MHTGYINSFLYSQCRNELKGDPTTGCSTIYTIVNLAKNSKIDFYGFSFTQNNTIENCAIHYFNDRDRNEALQRTSNHDLNLESAWLKSFLRRQHYDI